MGALEKSPASATSLSSARQYLVFSSLAHTLEPVETSGTTVLLLVAAALWLMYLVPLWLKRSEYYATERNAARLGQTLRLLANTTEASQEIKAELRARSITRKEREAKRQLRIMSSPTLTLQERRRRTKQIFSLTLTLGLVSAGTAFLAAWPLEVIWASSTMATVSFAILSRLNRVSAKASSAMAQSGQYVSRAPAEPVNPRAWTPTPLPEPLTTGAVQEEAPLPSHDELVAKAQAVALSERPEQFEGEGLAVVSPFARMGEVTTQPAERPNLDEVLRRRRAV